MMHRSLFVGLSLWAATTMTATAEVYTWTDDQGTVHFTEDAGAVPKALRQKLRSSEEPKAAEADTAPAPQAAEEVRQPPPASNGEDTSPTDLFDGRTRDQWQQELQKREAAMAEVRNRLGELGDLARKASADKVEQDKLVAAYRELFTQFTDMRARYFQLVEAARKAGLQVDLQK
jgi:hypothetical protein